MTLLVAPLPFTRRIVGAAASAAVVAAIAYLVTLLAFFAASGAVTENLPQISDFFIITTLLTFVLLTVLAAVGGYRWWYTAALGGLIAAALATIIGTAINVLSTGVTFTSDLLAPLLGTLIGPHLIFVVVATVAAVTTGCRVWDLLVYPSLDRRAKTVVVQQLPHLLDRVITPGVTGDGPDVAGSTTLDSGLAEEQWSDYLLAFADNGWSIIELAAQLPDSAMIEEAIVVLDDVAVLGLSPESPSGEGFDRVGIEDAILDQGFAVMQIDKPGTVNAADLLTVGKTVYTGRSERTNAEGIRQLRALLSPLGYRVVTVPVTKAPSLTRLVSALPDGTVLGFSPLVDDPAVFGRFLAVPEASGASVAVLSDDVILVAASAPKSAELIAALGYRVVTVDIGEFEKRGSSIGSLSSRLR